jgi:20S proteasome alpha/beta subunit
MSLLVGLVGADGLVLATDSRGTFGDPRGVTAQNDQIKKLYLANDRAGILVAGAGDLGSTVVSSFLALPNIASLDATALAMALHTYARAQFGEWFKQFSIKPSAGDSRPSRPDLNFIVAGLDSNHASRIYRLSSSLEFAPMLHNYGFGVDGVAQYALYLLNRLYDPEAVIEDLTSLAAYLVTETASQDGKVGGPVQIATISASSSQSLCPEAVEEIVFANKERSRALRKSFLRGPYRSPNGSAPAGEPGFPQFVLEAAPNVASQLEQPFQSPDAPLVAARSSTEDEMTETCPSGVVW